MGASIVGQSGSGNSTITIPAIGPNGGGQPGSSIQIGDFVAGVFTPISPTNPLPVDGTITAVNASVGLTGVLAPAFATEIGIVDINGKLQAGGTDTNPIRVDPTGTTIQPVSGIVSVSNFPAINMVQGTAASGTPVSGNPVQMGAVYSEPAPIISPGSIEPLQCDPAGSLFINSTGRISTYRACASAFSPMSDPSIPFFVIQGSATKTIRIRNIRISWACTTGNAAPNVIQLRRYSAVSGGTPNVVTPVPNDTSNPTATAAVFQYSGLPAVTPFSAGVYASQYMQWVTNAAGFVGPSPIELEFAIESTQALTLRGTSDFFGIAVAAVATGSLMTIWVTWTEN